MERSRKLLIVNADDFGLSCGITEGIAVAHQKGIVTSASLMANQNASDYAIQIAKQYPTLGIGVHLNLCEGRPVLPRDRVRTLVTKEGYFYPVGELSRRLWNLRVSSRELEAELRAQISWIKDRAITPIHADSHQHMHVHPCVVRPFIRALTAEGIRYMRAPRHRHWPRKRYLGGPHAGRLHRRLLVSTYMDVLQYVTFRSMHTPDCCLLYHPRFSRDLDRLGEGWRLALDSIPPGAYEIGCHPGLSERGFSENDSYSLRRELEFRFLTGHQLRVAIERNSIQLITYSQLSQSDVSDGRH
jgi:predicted glycoside hydrolase/deacetylase ChbG (UPF0249 family)